METMGSSHRLQSAELWGVALFLFFLLAIFFWRVIFLGEAFLGADVLYLFYPWRSLASQDLQVANPLFGDIVGALYPSLLYMVRAIKSGHFPLWNPYVAGGQPLGTLITSCLLYPLNFLFYVFPLGQALGYHAMARVFIAGLFTYLLLREWEVRWEASLLAAVVFMFNGFHVVWLNWPHTYVSVLLPLLFWLTQRLVRTGSISWAVFLAFAVGVTLLGGFPLFAAYAFYALVAFFTFSLLRYFRQTGDKRGALYRALGFSLALLGGGLLVSPQILPFLRNLALSRYEAQRVADISFYREFHFPLQNLILFLIPDYYGNSQDIPFWGVANYIETTGYVGVFSLFLVGMALFASFRRGLVWFFTGLAGVAGGVVFGVFPIQGIVSRLPVLNASHDTRLLGILAFCLALLAGMGLEAILEPRRSREVLGIASTAGLSLLVIFSTELYWTLSLDGPSAPIRRTLIWALQNGDPRPLGNFVLFSFLFAAGLLIIILRLTGRISGRALTFLSLGILVIDLFSFGLSFNSTVDPQRLYPSTESLQFLQQEVSPFRFLALGETMYPNTAMVYGLQDVGGHSITHPWRYTRLLQLIDPEVWNRRKHGTLLLFGRETANLDSPLLDLLNVRYILDEPGACEAVGHQQEGISVPAELPVGEIVGGVEQGQSFHAHGEGLDQVCLILATYRRVNDRDLIFHLKESPTASQDLVTLTVNGREIKDNSWYSFRFSPIEDSGGRTFYFSLESPQSTPGNAITIWASQADAYAEGFRYENGKVREGDLVFNLSYALPKSRFQTIARSDLTLYRNPTVLPRAYVVHQAEVIKDEEGILRRLTSTDFDPRESVILEEEPPGPLDEELSPSDSSARILDYQPSSVVVEVEMTGRGFLVLGDQFYPDWKAFVDGREERIYQADYVFRAVYLPSGRHRVEFVFTAQLFKMWLVVSIFTFGVIMVILFSNWLLPKWRRVVPWQKG